MPPELDSYPDFEMSVRRLIAEWAKIPESKVSGDTCVNCGGARGLGVAGADGVDLMNYLGAELGADLSQFDAMLYFGPEAGIDFRSIKRFVSGKKVNPKLTIGILSRTLFDLSRRSRRERQAR